MHPWIARSIMIRSTNSRAAAAAAAAAATVGGKVAADAADRSFAHCRGQALVLLRERRERSAKLHWREIFYL